MVTLVLRAPRSLACLLVDVLPRLPLLSPRCRVLQGFLVGSVRDPCIAGLVEDTVSIFEHDDVAADAYAKTSRGYPRSHPVAFGSVTHSMLDTQHSSLQTPHQNLASFQDDTTTEGWIPSVFPLERARLFDGECVGGLHLHVQSHCLTSAKTRKRKTNA
jgi:hypothetical protein